jgi:hypothetical protein
MPGGFFTNNATPASNTAINGIGAAVTSDAGNADDLFRELAAQGRQFANALTLSSGSPGTYGDHLIAVFVALYDNTIVAPTIAFNGLAAKTLKRAVAGAESALVAGSIQAGGLYAVKYRSAWASAAGAFQLIDLNGGEVSGAVSGTMAQYQAALSDGDFLFASDLGQETIWVPAGSMTPNTTNGPSSATAETATNKVMVPTLDFDATTQESAQFMVQMPKSWDEGTIIAQFIWCHGATTTNFGVVWDIAAVALSDTNALDTAFGTAVTATDTGGTTDNVYASPETAEMTVGNSPAAEDLVVFRVRRAPANGSDTMAVDAKLIGVKLHYTTNALSDT